MSTPSALIIGEDGTRVPHLVQYLQSLGCRCQFAACFEDACRLISGERFDLVFSPVRRQPGTISSLMEALTGSGASLFCSYAVKDGCWWLPVIHHGEPCLGSPAFQPEEFAKVLAIAIRELDRQAAPEHEGSGEPLPLSTTVNS